VNNLERLICAMGFERINPESLTALRAAVGDPVRLGAFTALANRHGLSALVGSESRREYESLMAQGAEMFAPVVGTPAPVRRSPTNDPILLLNLAIAVLRLIDLYDETTSNSEGHYPGLDPGCNDCTQGCTPRSADTGLCPYHFGKQVLLVWARRNEPPVGTPTAVDPEQVEER
jgi:hypothetical protein